MLPSYDVAERDEIVNDDDTSFFTENDKTGNFFAEGKPAVVEKNELDSNESN